MWICRGLVKGLQCPQCSAPSLTAIAAQDTNSPQHSDKNSGIDTPHHCQHCPATFIFFVKQIILATVGPEIWLDESGSCWNSGISRARLIDIPTRRLFGNIHNFPSYLGISRACLINFPTTGKFGNIPNIPKPGRAYHEPICPFDKSVRRTRSFWESGHFLHICRSDDGIIVRIDFWQIEAGRAGDTQSYAVDWEKSGEMRRGVSWPRLLNWCNLYRRSTGRGGGASQMAHFEIFCFCQLYPVEGGGDYQAKTADCQRP